MKHLPKQITPALFKSPHEVNPDSELKLQSSSEAALLEQETLLIM